MQQIILYLEDDASMRQHTTDYLREKGYNVEDFRRIDQVKEFFPNNRDDISCVITDLNMSDEWLGEYRKESDGCMLSGWVWLQRYVYPLREDIPTIIYSGYISYLHMWLKKNKKSELLKMNNIICVEKGARQDEGFSGLLSSINKILKK